MHWKLCPILALLLACQSPPSVAEAPAAPASAAAAPMAETGAAALEPVVGDTAVDQELRTLQEVTRRLPDRADSWIRLAQGWVKKARNTQNERLYGRAEAAAQRALSLSPGHTGARRVLALVFQNAHRFKEMHALATEMTRDEPKNADAWGLLCDAALERGQYAEAEKACQRMLDLAPGLPAFARAAWLRWVGGDADGALELWQEAVRLAPNRDPEPRAWCLSEVGHLEWNRGRLDAADQAYAAALALKADHAPSLFGQGRVALARGDGPGAVKALRAAQRARANEVTSAWLAAALRSMDQAADAEPIEAALAAAGDFDDPRSTALFLAAHRKAPEKAVALARQDLAARGDVFAEDALGFTLLRAGKLDEAADFLARALRLGTPDPLLLAHAGLLAVAQNRPAEARALLGKALALNPHFDPTLGPEAAAALAALPPEVP